jgi:TRAP-type transport system small permease protein
MTFPWRSMANQVAYWSGATNRGVELFLVLLGVGMALLTGAQVFFRYVLNHSLFWSEEVGRICLVWLSFLGATAAYRRGAHIGIGFFVEKLPQRLRFGLRILVQLASLAFFIVLIVAGGQFVWFAAGHKTPALGISKFIPYLIMPLSGLVFTIHGCHQLLELVLERPEDR